MMVGTVPHGDAMSPPQLAADTPILDVLQPVEIGLLKTLGYDLDAPISHSFQRGFCQRFDRHEPLRGDHRLDDLSAALCARDGCAIRLSLNEESCLLHICLHVFTRLESIL